MQQPAAVTGDIPQADLVGWLTDARTEPLSTAHGNHERWQRLEPGAKAVHAAV